MLRYDTISTNTAAFEELTGVSVTAFNKLAKGLESRYKTTSAAEGADKVAAVRILNSGAGRRFTLTLRDRLVMMLMRTRTNATYELLSELFGINKTNIYRNIERIRRSLEDGELPDVTCKNPEKKIHTKKQLKDAMPKAKAVLG